MKRIKTVRNLRGEVYKIIRQGISDGSLAPGTQLKESELVKNLGVSRTPIREALNQLSKEGLIEIVTGRGAFVKRWTKDQVIEILYIREVLESLAARLAARQFTETGVFQLEEYMAHYRDGKIDYAQADKLFHDYIVNASGMDRLVDMINNLYDSIQMANTLRIIFMFPGRIEESMAEHGQLIEAFKSGDEDTAEKVARDHFQQTRKYYIRLAGD